MAEGRFDIKLTFDTPRECSMCGEIATGFRVEGVKITLRSEDPVREFNSALAVATMDTREIIMTPCECVVKR